MTIEKTIEDLTVAINALTGNIQKLITIGAVQAAGFAKSPEAAFKAAEAQAAVSAPKTEKPKAQTKAKADKTDKELLNEVLEEAESDDGLPAGDRDAAYYEKHVRPHFMALADANRDSAVALLDSFGVKTAKALDASRWGELVAAVKDTLVKLAGGADEDDLG
jgi:hypothetical protein